MWTVVTDGRFGTDLCTPVCACASHSNKGNKGPSSTARLSALRAIQPRGGCYSGGCAVYSYGWSLLGRLLRLAGLVLHGNQIK